MPALFFIAVNYRLERSVVEFIAACSSRLERRYELRRVVSCMKIPATDLVVMPLNLEDSSLYLGAHIISRILSKFNWKITVIVGDSEGSERDL